MSSYNEFKSQVLGRGFDVDGWYGYQCWDGYAKYCQYLGVPFANCTTTGYVIDIWNNRHSNGILNYFTEVSEMQPGDVAVFVKSGSTPSTHIAIFDSDAGNGYGNFLGQNQAGTNGPNGGKVFDIIRIPYSATTATAFRPKSLGGSTPTPQKSTQSNTASGWVSERGTFTLTYPIYARESGPSTANKSPYKFPAGSKVTYDAYIHTNGYVWIRQPRSGGGYWYIPTGESNGASRTGSAWGTFA